MIRAVLEAHENSSPGYQTRRNSSGHMIPHRNGSVNLGSTSGIYPNYTGPRSSEEKKTDHSSQHNRMTELTLQPTSKTPFNSSNSASMKTESKDYRSDPRIEDARRTSVVSTSSQSTNLHPSSLNQSAVGLTSITPFGSSSGIIKTPTERKPSLSTRRQPIVTQQKTPIRTNQTPATTPVTTVSLDLTKSFRSPASASKRR